MPGDLFSEGFVGMLKEKLTTPINLLYKNQFSEVLDDHRWDEHVMALGLMSEENRVSEDAAKD